MVPLLEGNASNYATIVRHNFKLEVAHQVNKRVNCQFHSTSASLFDVLPSDKGTMF